jgi:threonine dehydrogenase-like Zn-dependent dehydrogenase
MRAAVLDECGVRFERHHRPREPSPGEVLVRILKAGVCETDLQLIRGYMGFRGVLGHEFVGVAEEGRFAGRRVAGEINCPCRRCDLCARDLGNHCPHRTVIGILNHDGVFADRVWLPEENLHPVPDALSDDVAVFVEPVAAAYQVPSQLDLSRLERIMVLGDGRLGNLCAQVAAAHNENVVIVGKHPAKLAILESFGLATCLLADAPRDRGADLVIDCTGSPDGLRTALALVRPRGVVVLKTTTASDTGPNLAPVVIDEVTIVGSRCGPFPRAIEALSRGEVRVEPLISARFALEQITAAIDKAQSPGVLKVLIDVS